MIDEVGSVVDPHGALYRVAKKAKKAGVIEILDLREPQLSDALRKSLHQQAELDLFLKLVRKYGAAQYGVERALVNFLALGALLFEVPGIDTNDDIPPDVRDYPSLKGTGIPVLLAQRLARLAKKKPHLATHCLKRGLGFGRMDPQKVAQLREAMAPLFDNLEESFVRWLEAELGAKDKDVR